VGVEIAPPIDVEDVTRTVIDRIRASSPVAHNARVRPALSHVARELAAGLAIGWREQSLWPPIARDLAQRMVTPDYRVLAPVIRSTFDPHKLAVDQWVPGEHFEEIGVAVVQSARNGALAGQTWVVVLFGQQVSRGHGHHSH
jgi:hypothetical protein